jgi:hypothetical protein
MPVQSKYTLTINLGDILTTAFANVTFAIILEREISDATGITLWQQKSSVVATGITDINGEATIDLVPTEDIVGNPTYIIQFTDENGVESRPVSFFMPAADTLFSDTEKSICTDEKLTQCLKVYSDIIEIKNEITDLIPIPDVIDNGKFIEALDGKYIVSDTDPMLKADPFTKDNIIIFDSIGNAKDSGKKTSDFVDIAAIDAKQDKDIDAVTGNLGEFDINGNTIDSGRSLSQIDASISGKIDKQPSATDGNFSIWASGQLIDAESKPADYVLISVQDPINTDFENRISAMETNKENKSEKGVANGYTPLDNSAKIPIEFLPVGDVVTRGTFGSALSTTGGDLPSVGNRSGDKYICDTNGYNSVEAGQVFDSGDAALYFENVWYKIDNNESVTSVHGRTGAVVSQAGDYDYTQITDFQIGVSGNLDVIAAKAHADIIDGNPHNTKPAQIEAENLATPRTIQQLFSDLLSAGSIEGGEITDNGDGSVNISEIKFYIKEGSSDISNMIFGVLPEQLNIAIDPNTTNFLSVFYNSGSPVLEVKQTRPDNFNERFCVGKIIREADTKLHINTASRCYLAAPDTNNLRRIRSTNPLQRAYNGGAVISSTVGLFVTVTAGLFWENFNPVSTVAFDSSGVDRFNSYYQDGLGGFTRIDNVNVVDNLFYDDGSGTLAVMGTGKFSARYFYLGVDSEVVMIYGRSQYNTQGQAEEDTIPSPIPAVATLDHSVLIGRVIVQQNNTTPALVESAFDTVFQGADVTEHNGLSGIQGGTATEYYHLTLAKYNEILAGVVANVAGIQTLTNKTINADSNTISNLVHGSEVNNPASGVHGVEGDIVGTTDPQALSNKSVNGVTLIDNGSATSYLNAQGDYTAIPGGVNSFLDLNDTPASYFGQAGKAAVVNIAENGLDFAEVGGVWNEIATYTITASVSAIEFINIPAGFNRLVILFSNLTSNAGGTAGGVQLRLSSDNGSSWLGSVYGYVGIARNSAGGELPWTSSTNNIFLATRVSSEDHSLPTSGEIYISGYGLAARTQLRSSITGEDLSGVSYSFDSDCNVKDNVIINAIEFAIWTKNMDNGIVVLYGIT